MPPILDNKNPKSQSVFLPSALLREARRQKGIAAVDVPPVCILDPDGDILRRIISTGKAKRLETWPCYHTDLYTFSLAGETVKADMTLCRESALAVAIGGKADMSFCTAHVRL